VSIIVGIVVGTSIFLSTDHLRKRRTPWMAMALWILGAYSPGAALSATRSSPHLPARRRDYEYLNRAFGTWCGFLFSWAQLATVISGNIAIMGLRLRRLRRPPLAHT